MQVNKRDCACFLFGPCLQIGFTLPCLFWQYGTFLTRFLFRFVDLRLALRSTHPSSMTGAKEPLSISP